MSANSADAGRAEHGRFLCPIELESKPPAKRSQDLMEVPADTQKSLQVGGMPRISVCVSAFPRPPPSSSSPSPVGVGPAHPPKSVNSKTSHWVARSLQHPRHIRRTSAPYSPIFPGTPADFGSPERRARATARCSPQTNYRTCTTSPCADKYLCSTPGQSAKSRRCETSVVGVSSGGERVLVKFRPTQGQTSAKPCNTWPKIASTDRGWAWIRARSGSEFGTAPTNAHAGRQNGATATGRRRSLTSQSFGAVHRAPLPHDSQTSGRQHRALRASRAFGGHHRETLRVVGGPSAPTGVQPQLNSEVRCLLGRACPGRLWTPEHLLLRRGKRLLWRRDARVSRSGL